MTVRLLTGDCRDVLRTLPDQSVHCCVTSPPYWGLRSYLPDDHPDKAREIGSEPTVEAWVQTMVEVFREVRRVLRDDGTLWLNLGDSYAGNRGAACGPSDSAKEARAMVASRRRDDHPVPRSDVRMAGYKPKDLIGQPWLVAFALRADGWWLRQEIIWAKPNPMPESCRDRFTKAHEHIFLLSKSERYRFDVDAIREPAETAERKGPRRSYKAGSSSSMHTGEHQQMTGGFAGLPLNPLGRNKRSVWSVPTAAFNGAHFATFPPNLIRPCILAGCPAGGVVLDPFGGAGTVGLVADRLQRDAVLIDLNDAYVEMQRRRIASDAPLFAQVDE